MTPEALAFRARLDAWRTRSPEDQAAHFEAHRPEEIKARLALVRECPDRGGVLPISMQREGCGRCGELSECRRMLGTVPGRTSLRDCLDCVSGTARP